LKALPEGQYIKHFQYGLGVVTESDNDRTSIDFDLHGPKKFVTSIMVVEMAEGTPPKRKRAKRVKKVAAVIAAAEPVGDELVDHGLRARCIIGRVAVDQHVEVGFDIIEHPPHHVTLALMGLAADHCARRCGGRDGAVCRVVVVNINTCAGQRRAEIGDHFGDCAFFIVTGHQNRDIERALEPVLRTVFHGKIVA